MNYEEYRKSFPPEAGTVLKVYHRNGGVDVCSWDRDYIEVTAVKKMRWWTDFLKGPDISVTTGKEFVVRTLYSTALSQAIPIQYRITVPKGVLVSHLETSVGRINVDNVTGDLDAKTSTGEIGIHEVTGFVKAVTNTGRIKVDKTSGDVEVKTSTGTIQIHEVKGFVTALSKSGKIEIAKVGGLYGACTSTGNIVTEVPAIRDNLEIKSGSGSIKAFLSPEIAAQLEISSNSGNIDYKDLPLTVDEISRTSLSGRLGAGSGEINIKTCAGSITLKNLSLERVGC